MLCDGPHSKGRARRNDHRHIPWRRPPPVAYGGAMDVPETRERPLPVPLPPAWPPMRPAAQPSAPPLPQGPLETARLVLRPWQEDDIPALHKICQDPDIQRWTTVPSPYAMSDAEWF